jgi:hypothetical protein
MKKFIITSSAVVFLFSASVAQAEIFIFTTSAHGKMKSGLFQPTVALSDRIPPFEIGKGNKVFILCRDACQPYLGTIEDHFSKAGYTVVDDRSKADYQFTSDFSVAMPDVGKFIRADKLENRETPKIPAIFKNTTLNIEAQDGGDITRPIMNEIAGQTMRGALSNSSGIASSLGNVFAVVLVADMLFQKKESYPVGTILLGIGTEFGSEGGYFYGSLIGGSDTEETPDAIARATYAKLVDMITTTGIPFPPKPGEPIVATSTTEAAAPAQEETNQTPRCPAGYILSKTEAETCVLDPSVTEVNEAAIPAPADAAATAE